MKGHLNLYTIYVYISLYIMPDRYSSDVSNDSFNGMDILLRTNFYAMKLWQIFWNVWLEQETSLLRDFEDKKILNVWDFPMMRSYLSLRAKPLNLMHNMCRTSFKMFCKPNKRNSGPTSCDEFKRTHRHASTMCQWKVCPAKIEAFPITDLRTTIL